jgi:hypothetical protein
VLEGRIAHALGERDQALKSLRQAVAEARAREAPWLELIALSALCEQNGANAKDRAALRDVLDRVTEGLDTPRIANARALLNSA